MVLGGLTIPHELGLEGHSDADVLVHALCDALLGAAALGDVGEHFPDSDSKWKDADSMDLLSGVLSMLAEDGWKVGNIDCTIMAEAPRLAPHRDAMRENLAKRCGIDKGKVSVKATTVEGLGSIGRREGIAAHAVVMIHDDEKG